MSFDSNYTEQVDLLLDVLPVINKFDCFALKGGTAINLFIRNMPRLSVDIDLAYLPIEPREIFLLNITKQLNQMKKLISEQDSNLVVKPSFMKSGQLAKLFVYKNDAVIKIEPNFVIRGSVYSCEEYGLCQKTQDQFLKFCRTKTLSFADLYGGKICAALDRQHPRDLFDVKLLFDNQGITEDVRIALIVYLISSPRPLHELLTSNPNLKDFEKTFNKEFTGMTNEILVDHQELIDTRHRLIKEILNDLTEDERKFLMSFKQGEPNWSLISAENVVKLPAVLWKLENIRKIPKDKWMQQQNNLKKILGL